MFCVVQHNSAGESVDYWCTPGGGLDLGEPIVTGLERELIEETGIRPTVGNLLLVQQFIDSKGREQLELFFHIKNAEDYLHIDLAETSHGHHEIEEFAFVDVKKTKILPKILTELDLSKLITSQKPPIILNEIPKKTKITPQD